MAFLDGRYLLPINVLWAIACDARISLDTLVGQWQQQKFKLAVGGLHPTFAPRRQRMKVYIAAPWPKRARAEEVAGLCEEAGLTITRKWWEHEATNGGVSSPSTGEGESVAFLRECADADLKAVRDADAVICLIWPKEIEAGCGQWWESGAAAALGVTIYQVGGAGNHTQPPRRSIFDMLGNVRHTTVTDAIATIRRGLKHAD